MATQIYLIRHGHHALLGSVLCGRMPGVKLDELGCWQMALCAEAISVSPLLAVQSSPQRRAQQSANILAWHNGFLVETVPAMDEINVGDWTGRSFDELARDRNWKHWNERRDVSLPPNGESMRALQTRVVDHLETTRNDHPDGTIAIVSHAEPIRAALMHYLGIPLDNFQTIDVDPASISTIFMDGNYAQVVSVNQRVFA